MAGIVVDSSVFAAIAFDEPNAKEALALLGGREFYAPSLMAFEVTTLLGRRLLGTLPNVPEYLRA